ncbi:hypothetical protein B0H16DRAFT_1746437 [Mycena metata]|uniref:Uncharacterized protein n=1 Tax=Mycena metata TaxID=1033252 RepID=A0AAD7MA85_9AGAR|nr:hypothetical protein B0H16DRAFT_1746437 [Mycena metata]
MPPRSPERQRSRESETTTRTAHAHAAFASGREDDPALNGWTARVGMGRGMMAMSAGFVFFGGECVDLWGTRRASYAVRRRGADSRTHAYLPSAVFFPMRRVDACVGVMRTPKSFLSTRDMRMRATLIPLPRRQRRASWSVRHSYTTLPPPQHALSASAPARGVRARAASPSSPHLPFLPPSSLPLPFLPHRLILTLLPPLPNAFD